MGVRNSPYPQAEKTLAAELSRKRHEPDSAGKISAVPGGGANADIGYLLVVIYADCRKKSKTPDESDFSSGVSAQFYSFAPINGNQRD
jgi:hypothetical protein